ncbi:cytochrome P450 [Halovulum sp. GXIMD14793]
MTEKKLFTPAMPESRPDKAGAWYRLRAARQDMFSSLPHRLYSAWMAQQRFVLFDSFLINDPKLVKLVLEERTDDFPKTSIIHDTLFLLLGNSVFVTNGEVWKRQRRIIDPAFEGGKLRDSFAAMVAAGESCLARLKAQSGQVEMEFETSHCAADVIFRTLFSRPIEDEKAKAVFDAFRAYQSSQPLINILSLLKLPRWVPRWRSGASRRNARVIRELITRMTEARQAEIAAGTAPNDLTTKIMTTADPVTGQVFDTAEMVDQVAIFFLAGHETSAAALSWTLYMLAECPEVQVRAAAEARAAWEGTPDFSVLRKLPFVRDVFREALRLYPPVPMLPREAIAPEKFRQRKVRKGSLLIVSPWHLQRHERIWDNPHQFDPERWTRPETKEVARQAYLPFSSGSRVCPGAGFAMAEGVILLAILLRELEFAPVKERKPQPVHHLTVRAKDGIWLKVAPRG